MASVEVNDRLYYTGDMANPDGWGTVRGVTPPEVEMVCDDGRVFHILAYTIGDTYKGHCDPPFVTAKAVLVYRAGRFPLPRKQ